MSRETSAVVGGATVVTLRGSLPGPTVVLLGGVHGDEDEGVLAARHVLDLVEREPLRGTIRVVAPAHPAAWAAYERLSPLDGGDLARSFPGGAESGPTAALAGELTEQAIDGADLLIDLHSAGLLYEMPLLCGFVDGLSSSPRARDAAAAFAAPITWVHPDIGPGRTLSVAADRAIPAIYAECSGGGSIRAHELDAYVDGVVAVLAHLGMLAGRVRRRSLGATRWVHGSGDLDAGAAAGRDGFFVTATVAGSVLPEGATVGSLYEYSGRLVDVVRTPREGMVMFLRRRARTRAGDILFTLAEPIGTRA